MNTTPCQSYDNAARPRTEGEGGLYLTRIWLDDRKRQTMLAYASPNRFHGAVERCFGGGRKRRLWRIDRLRGQHCLLIVSQDVPETASLCEQFGDAGHAETKPYAAFVENIQQGTTWRFRLVANPTHSLKPEGGGLGARGKVVAHVGPSNCMKWLLGAAQSHGFEVDPAKTMVTGSQWQKFRKGNGENQVSLLSVAFEGVLTVTDEGSFRAALANGIGRGKAYGMGMLTVVRAA